MPTPTSAFAAIGEIIGRIDPDDLRALDDFFMRQFSCLDEHLKETAFYWALSLDRTPTDEDRHRLRDMLDELGFAHLREAIVDADEADGADEPSA